jgi:hypothetical protein
MKSCGETTRRRICVSGGNLKYHEGPIFAEKPGFFSEKLIIGYFASFTALERGHSEMLFKYPVEM